MRRFLPNFKVLTGNNQITLSVKDFPADSDTQTSLSPFTITSLAQLKLILGLEEDMQI